MCILHDSFQHVLLLSVREMYLQHTMCPHSYRPHTHTKEARFFFVKMVTASHVHTPVLI